MAYSKEYKEDILSRFHASGVSMRAACKLSDDFPDPRSLSKFVSEEEAGLLHPTELEVLGRCEDHQPWESYPLKTKREALRLLAGGMKAHHIAKRLNVAYAASIRLWASNLARFGELDTRSRVDATPRKAVMMFEQGLCVAEVAKETGASRKTVYQWLDRSGIVKKRSKTRRDVVRMTEKRNDEEPGEWARAWGSLPDDPEKRARMAEVRLAEALAVLDVLKAPGPSSLSNAEKHRAGEMARAMTMMAGVCDILSDFHIAKSTYFSQEGIAAKPDKYAALRVRVRIVFEESKGRYGSKSIWAKLREGEGVPVCATELTSGDNEVPVIVSEKVIRDIMRKENLVPVQIRRDRRHYNSYKGELGRRPENLLLCEDGTHDFHAEADTVA